VRLGDDDDLHEDPERDQPLDLAALRADDALVDDLAAGLLGVGDRAKGSSSADDELLALLSAWVAEVRPEAVDAAAGARPEPEPAPVPAVTGTTAPGRHRTPAPAFVQRLAVAAALIVLATSGLAVGAWEATPGQPLWGITKVFYAERAHSAEAAAEVSTNLATAREALRSGRRAEAAQAIAAITGRLDVVSPDHGHDALVEEQNLLVAELVAAAGPMIASVPAPTAGDPAGSGPPSSAADGGSGTLASPPAPDTAPATDGSASTTPPAAAAAPGTPGGPAAPDSSPPADSSAPPTISEPQTQPEPEPPTQPQTQPEPGPQTQPEPGPQTQPEPGPQPQPQPQSQPGTAPQPQTQTQPQTQPTQQRQTQPQAQPEPPARPAPAPAPAPQSAPQPQPTPHPTSVTGSVEGKSSSLLSPIGDLLSAGLGTLLGN
jgi:hypothetical protein